MSYIRAFVAIHLPEPLLLRLDDIIKQLQGSLPSGVIRWVRPEGIHLTLVFLGDVPPEKLVPIQESMQKAARRFNRFVLNVSKFDCFPNLRRPRTLWVGVQDSTQSLKELQTDLAEEMSTLGFAKESRPFHPHLTLGRVKKHVRGRDADALSQSLSTVQVDSLGDIQVAAIHLIRSDLRPSGAVYTTLYSAHLAGET